MTQSVPLPPAAVAYFADLDADNSRAFWAANRERYERDVRAPFLALLEALGPGHGPWRVYRPHANLRFRPDAPPLKPFIGAVDPRPDGTGFHVQLSVRGLLAATGMPELASDQLARFRAAVAGDAGADLVAALAAASAGGLEVRHGRHAPLKRVPRGAGPEHPRGALLRWRGVEAAARFGVPPWLAAGEAPARVLAAWAAAAPVNAWLAAHVGPSGRSPQERYAPRASPALRPRPSGGPRSGRAAASAGPRSARGAPRGTAGG